MKLKVADIVQASAALVMLARRDLPAKIAYRIAKLTRAVQREEAEYRAAYDQCLAKHGVPVADKPGTFTVAREKVDAFNNDVKDLRAEEVELAGVMPVDYNDIAHLSVPAELFIDLEALLVNQPVDEQPGGVTPSSGGAAN